MPTRSKPAATFASRLRDLRQAAGLTVYALAAKADLSRQGLAMLERGDRVPTLPTLEALADALGCTLQDLTGRA